MLFRSLTYVIQNTDMTTSYKMVWIRSIIEICKEKPNLNVISFDEISEKTFVEETDSSKQVAAGAGLTDND